MNAGYPEYRIVLAPQLQGPDPVSQGVDHRLLDGPPARVRIELDNVTFVRPSGLGYLYVLVYSLLRRGHDIRITEPIQANSQSYLRRTDFWSLLSRHGFIVPEQWHGYNLGHAPGLIECSLVTTDATLDENMQSSVISYDRLRRAMQQAGLTGRDRTASVFAELVGNAAEHSRSPRGAFVAAQAYGQLGEIEIVVADVGIGIRAALDDPTMADDEAAIRAAMQEGVTGRRDAGGAPAEGGFGLPTAVIESARLIVRSGTAVVRSTAGAVQPPADTAVSAVTPLDGTLVIADVSA